MATNNGKTNGIYLGAPATAVRLAAAAPAPAKRGRKAAPAVAEDAPAAPPPAAAKAPARKTPGKVDIGNIVIPAPRHAELHVHITGITPLLVHAWDPKARQMILDKHMGKPTKKLPPKDPEECFQNSMYRFPDGGHGFPTGAFKDSMVQACRFAPDLTMTLAKLLFFVQFDGLDVVAGMRCVRINGKPQRHDAMVRINNGSTADYRIRAIYPEWKALLRINYNADMVQPAQLMNLVALAGLHVGIGEMRPSSPESNTGELGRWMVDDLAGE